MSSLINEVTPLTRGIIWLAQDRTNTENPYYSEIDYLLDGLLTAASGSATSVMVGSNFNKSLIVMITNEIKQSDFQSYFSLLENLSAEENILVIDELKLFDKVSDYAGKLSSSLRQIQKYSHHT